MQDVTAYIAEPGVKRYSWQAMPRPAATNAEAFFVRAGPCFPCSWPRFWQLGGGKPDTSLARPDVSIGVPGPSGPVEMGVRSLPRCRSSCFGIGKRFGCVE